MRPSVPAPQAVFWFLGAELPHTVTISPNAVLRILESGSKAPSHYSLVARVFRHKTRSLLGHHIPASSSRRLGNGLLNSSASVHST